MCNINWESDHGKPYVEAETLHEQTLEAQEHKTVLRLQRRVALELNACALRRLRLIRRVAVLVTIAFLARAVLELFAVAAAAPRERRVGVERVREKRSGALEERPHAHRHVLHFARQEQTREQQRLQRPLHDARVQVHTLQVSERRALQRYFKNYDKFIASY